jgi:ADP-heptose:LPS heptosyltransferase
MPPAQPSRSFPFEISEILSESDRQFIDRYTLEEREVKEIPGEGLALHTRIRRGVEGINRRIGYRLLRGFMKNVPTKRRVPIQEVRSIFIVPIGEAIGDMMVTLPLFHTIKRHNPNCRVGTLYSTRNKALIRCDHSIDETYEFRNRWDVGHYSELYHARKDGYDVVVNLNMNRMSEFGIICNIISPGGTKVCTAHARKKMYRILFNHLLPFDRGSMHLSQFGLAMLESVIDFGTSLQQWESHPKIQVSPEIEKNVGDRIDNHLRAFGADWFVHFNPQARNPTREWGLENAFEFAKKFVAHYDRGAILFTASPALRQEVETKIQEHGLKRVAFFPTSYDLLELTELSKRSALIITPDTSVIHFGTASGKPTLVLWPDRDLLPMEWIPLQVPSLNLAPEHRGMPVTTISVESVWAAARKLLDKEWTASATSIGLDPEADLLYQASNQNSALQSLIEHSNVPRVFLDGYSESVPLRIATKLNALSPALT